MTNQSANLMSMPGLATQFKRYQSLIVPVLFIAMLAVIVVPVPTVMIDLLVTANLALASLILMTTLYVKSPLDFSSFPSLLLGTAMFRLVLNIATTRLILSMDADSPDQATAAAGRVVQAFAEFVTGGAAAGATSVVVGAILFVILIIVQFVVITKGATRISEVAARFQLDGMPGKQMAIDADLNAGLIDEKQAKARRKRIADESDFYGHMDGAAKFVRGDAIAGIIITVINVIGGFAVGIAIKGWSFGDSLQVFTLLTIGDGLVSQLPALVISLAAGLIATRSNSDQDIGTELTQQLTSRHAALAITAGFLVVMAFTGMPMMPMLMAASSLGGLAFLMHRAGQRREVADVEAAKTKAAERPEKPPVEQSLHVDTLELEVGYGLVRLVDASQGGDLLDRIDMIRRQLAGELGFVMPPVRIRDNMQLQPNDYHIKLRGNAIASGQVYPGQYLAMDSGLASEPLQGLKTREPAFGLEATWIDAGQKQRAEAFNYTVVDATSVLATHMTETVKSHAAELLSREETNNLITQLKEKAPKLVEEVLGAPNSEQAPPVKPAELQKVLQNLLRERVPIRDLETILETLGDWATRTKDLEVLTEYVRNALRRTICSTYTAIEPSAEGDMGMGDGLPMTKLYCVSLDPALEDRINGYIERSAEGTSMSMPPSVANRITAAIIQELQKLLQGGHHPVVLASPQVRASVRRLIEPHLPTAAVLGYNEVSKGVEVESLGLVQLQNERREELAGRGVGARS